MREIGEFAGRRKPGDQGAGRLTPRGSDSTLFTVWSWLKRGGGKTTVMFVCTGNICRSPMAEAMFRDLARDYPRIEVTSTGIFAADGESPSEDAEVVMRARGIDPSGLASERVNKKAVHGADFIFTMTEKHLISLKKMFPKVSSRMFALGEFCRNEEGLEDGIDIPDPIGQGKDAYIELFETLSTALPSVLDFVIGKGRH
ncbi:MAG: hypothetical protein AAF514_23120 [Verrucomicrobiota bacterium]